MFILLFFGGLVVLLAVCYWLAIKFSRYTDNLSDKQVKEDNDNARRLRLIRCHYKHGGRK